MEFVKQRIQLPVTNVIGDDSNSNHNKSRIHKIYKHSFLFEDSLRMIVSGKSGSGKTYAILSLLYHPNGLKFENVYVYCKSLFQPKYVCLKKVLDSIKGINCYLFSNNDDVIPPDKVKENSIFIFDDVICDSQNVIKLYFCLGRHRHVDVIYISQSYASIPKHLIRENANFAVIFKQDEMNLKHIFNDFVLSTDMDFNQFKEMCKKCWNEKHSFISIDIERNKNDGKYRKNFDTFIKFK